MKKVYFLIGFLSVLNLKVFASSPEVVCNGLPGCEGGATGEAIASLKDGDFFSFLGNIISEGIKYVAVLAVISLIISGIFYLISMGEDEKVNKAKKMIIWSLVGVLLSTSAWAIINMLNNFRI
ncbi:hypothetical protein H3C61_02005 [Candidatus Gracilibacteria bacterium]|nr:hypothetical protein [Candidatus Gracilibacteria bacterium]